MYLWTFYPLAGWNGLTDAIIPFTSNVAGWTWNAAIETNGPYFAALYPSTVTTTSSAAGAPSSTLTMAVAAVVVIIIVAIAAVVLRSRSKKTKT